MKKCGENYIYPRLSKMADFFENTASGLNGMPEIVNMGDVTLFKGDKPTISFYELHKSLRGNFDKHFYASIPYILEEECRVGSAICNYLIAREGIQSIYILGAAEGTMARTIGEYGKGKIKTLSCSPTKANQENFFKHGIPKNSYFALAPFLEITNPRDYFPCYEGFDIIIEDTTFQMYNNDRYSQIEFTKKKLKPDGIIGFIEKFAHDSIEDFLRREEMKDYFFKKRFFSSSDIQTKREDVLNTMHNCLVTLEAFKNICLKFFDYAVAIWNSGNFYTIYASNSKQNLLNILSLMPKSFTPSEFIHDPVPFCLYGLSNRELVNREIIR